MHTCCRKPADSFETVVQQQIHKIVKSYLYKMTRQKNRMCSCTCWVESIACNLEAKKRMFPECAISCWLMPQADSHMLAMTSLHCIVVWSFNSVLGDEAGQT